MPPRASLFRSAAFELRIDSPGAKVLPAIGSERPRTVPIFGHHDAVSGAVSVDTQFCSRAGRLVVTVSSASGPAASTGL
jgi:hypothetical protein